MNEVTAPSTLERVLRRDRVVTLMALVGASLLAWGYILSGAGMGISHTEMNSMSMPGMAMPQPWTLSYFSLMLAMWAIMMVAMMLPSAAPMVLLFATIERRRRDTPPFAAIAAFTAAYVIVWSGFSAAATVLQWWLDRSALLSSSMATTSGLIAGAVLVAAGIYQFTPLKQACLQNCRSPLEFISSHWNSGAFRMGLRHGVYCVGCCWLVMLLLFVGGIMNLIWVAVMATFIFAEKIAPPGRWLGYGVGVALMGWGIWTLYRYAALT